MDFGDVISIYEKNALVIQKSKIYLLKNIVNHQLKNLKIL